MPQMNPDAHATHALYRYYHDDSYRGAVIPDREQELSEVEVIGPYWHDGKYEVRVRTNDVTDAHRLPMELALQFNRVTTPRNETPY